MRILSCYIAGFGKFSNQQIDFQSNLLVIKQDNGWGKTTLADFIRCMLYGMDGGRTKSLETNDRLRYTPWNGGRCGGSLTFTYGGGAYRIERVFGQTPAQDVTRIFDSNNMPCYDFGEKGERLGEMLFGMDAESYKRTVYIPQGERQTDGLPQDIKGRLTALLGVSENTVVTENDGGRVALNAIERLDAADRALRARRRPAKGKLDEIDERLATLSRLKAEREENARRLEKLCQTLAQTETELADCQARVLALSQAIEEKQRLMPLSQTQISTLKADLEMLTAFFKGNDPALVNVDGIQAAVNEFYALKARLGDLEEKLAQTENKYKEKATVQARLSACEKVMESYETILGLARETDESGKKKPKYKKIVPPQKDWTGWVTIISLLGALLGAMLMSTQWIVGTVLVVAGVVGLIIVLCNVAPRFEKIEDKKKKEEPPKTQLSETERANFTAKYDQAKIEYAEIQAELARFAPTLDGEYESYQAEKESGTAKAAALEQGICNFFANFAFTELFDYRAAISMLKDKISSFKEKQSALSACGDGAVTVAPVTPNGETETLQGDIETLKAHKFAWESRKDELTESRARTLAEKENLEKIADPAAVSAEEESLLEEKKRLEKRHKAICMARQILLRAKDNLATRYLEPVEKGCRYYMSLLGAASGENVRFSADGTPLIEENGILRQPDGFSAGTQELLGFCTRIALADVLFQRELPTLIFDDPFINLDDEKTERAKWLTKELAKKYQILYLTCKKERAL